ncbi:MAG: cupin domain-containing protein [Actinomycetota bacterium]|nr:cupin domain-containing protein [Actinomycetota bacterium]
MHGVNILSVENLEGRVDVARAVGSTETAMFIYDLEPGQSSCPYHYEYEEEWLLVVDGTLVVRTPDGERNLERGDLVRFPSGPAGAHKVMNRSESPARMLMLSSSRVPAVSVYPDSDKIGVWPGEDADALIFKRGTAVPWSDGEEGWERAL